MKLISWNVHRFENLRTIGALCKLIFVEDPKLVFITETKYFAGQLEKIRVRCRIARYFGVNRVGLEGGLGLLWKEKVAISLLSFSVGDIDTNITFSSKKFFHFTSFYGSLEAILREHSL